MGKAGRVACIATPMLLTIASLVCLIIIEVSGWSSGSSTENKLYFFQANFTNLNVADANAVESSTSLTTALGYAKENNLLAAVYQIHLWNYCTQNTTTSDKLWCAPRHKDFYFDPVSAWGLNATTVADAAAASSTADSGAIASAVAQVKNNTEAFEDEILGKAGTKALNAYRHVSKWMFIAYAISFWTTIGTLVAGLLAIFSRWGSFLTWLFSITSTLFTFAAVLTSTILFAVLVGALESLLHTYDVKVTLNGRALAVTWLAFVFSAAATLFWLFSVCCCSGRSNPHHRSNKGGLWEAEPKGQGYGGYYDSFMGNGSSNSRGRGGLLRMEKTGGSGGGGYERVASPYLGSSSQAEASDRVPLQDYPAPQAGFPGAGVGRLQPTGYEPYRHS